MNKVARLVDVITRRADGTSKRQIVHTHRVPEFIKPKYRARHYPVIDLQHLNPDNLSGYHFTKGGKAVLV